MFGTPTRLLPVVAAAGLLAVSLSAVTTAPALGATDTSPRYQSGPFEVGNRLDYANTDFEGTTGNWVGSSNATLTDDTTHSFLHNNSLRDTAKHAGMSSFRISGTPNAIKITVKPGARYRVGAYFRTQGTGNETVEFSLGCFDLSHHFVGEVSGTTNPLLATTKWQYREDDITVPASPTHPKDSCAYIQGSPKVTLRHLPSNAAVNIDEVILAPYRAALIIGAKGMTNGDGKGGYNAEDWMTTNAKIGPLQSDKEFPQARGTSRLPRSWDASNNICHGIEQKIGSKTAKWPACVIAYHRPATQAKLEAFFKTMAGRSFPRQQMVIMVWTSEPELPVKKFAREPQCAGLTGAKAFVCEFEVQSRRIRAAAANVGRIPQVFVAMDAATSQYGPRGRGSKCQFIPPTTSTDFYLADHYDQHANGKSLPNESKGAGQKWTHWLSCVQSIHKPLGLGEYGLDCTTNPNKPVVTEEVNADNKYLETRTPRAAEPTIMWAYWYSDNQNSPGCVVTNKHTIATWRHAETQNGGGRR